MSSRHLIIRGVENISTELPGLHSIASDAEDLRYFELLATSLLEKDSWGLIAAVLGNSKNRKEFCKKFWWDEEVGLLTYLKEVSGEQQFVKEKKRS